MLTDTLNMIKKSCTGCAACFNSCPKSAIEMTPDSEGFFIPHIDEQKCISCGLCEKKCPQINTVKSNDPEPPCYAVKADKDTLAVSSSGGAFSLIADYVFDRGGYVCGAAYDEDFMGVSHIMISDKSEMYRLRGSKYVYSKPKDIYKQIKKKLEDGKWVLYCSTPCQTAALNSYLSPKKYERLITVDLLCGGVPSQKVFEKYMSEISEGRKISSVSFRPKKYGWDLSGIETKFEDGSEHMIHSVRDPYLRGFLNWLYKEKACADCSFAEPPRQGDISIGDFWNIKNYTDEIEDSDGVSCILINNEKGAAVFEEIKDNFKVVKRMPLSFLIRFNQMSRLRRSHLARARFFDLIDRGFDFKKAVDYSLGWKFDVAISGCWTVPNYGGDLTYYALYNTIKDMGYTVIMVERRANIPGYDVPKPLQFAKNPYPFYDVCRIHKSFNDQTELNARVRSFVLGSDQVWNYKLMNPDSIKSWSFDYVKDYRRKISYASSFGMSEFPGTEEEKKEFGNLLRRFNSVSVREKAGVDICSEFDVDAVQVLDPIFLCKKEHFERLINSAKHAVANGEYICTYFIHPTQTKYGVEKVCEDLKYGHIGTITCDKGMLKREGFYESKWPYSYEENISVEKWLKYLTNSKLIITDSFHATALAIIFNIQFVFVKGSLNVTTGMDRLGTLLGLTGLEDRVVTTVEEAYSSKIYLEEIDWESVNAVLQPEIDRSRKWLEDALRAEII